MLTRGAKKKKNTTSEFYRFYRWLGASGCVPFSILQGRPPYGNPFDITALANTSIQKKLHHKGVSGAMSISVMYSHVGLISVIRAENSTRKGLLEILLLHSVRRTTKLDTLRVHCFHIHGIQDFKMHFQ